MLEKSTSSEFMTRGHKAAVFNVEQKEQTFIRETINRSFSNEFPLHNTNKQIHE